MIDIDVKCTLVFIVWNFLCCYFTFLLSIHHLYIKTWT